MDRRTVETYQRQAVTYAERRRASDPARAEAFARALPDAALRLDLGCGPGFYLPFLGTPVVEADAAEPMVALARARERPTGSPQPMGVVCDLEALPFSQGAFAGVWASKCLQHVLAEQLPMTLAGLHRALGAGGMLDITMFVGTGTSVSGADTDDEYPGRLFTGWPPETLRQLLVGAGFEVESVEVLGPVKNAIPSVEATVGLTARRARSLPDTVGAGMRLLVCGLNPSLYAADAGVGFARPGNRFWPAARAAGLVSADLDRDPDAALRRDGIGMTDLVKRATVAASELSPDEYRAGLDRVEHLVRWLRPGAICFVGLAGWRAAVDRRAQPGIQPEGLGGVPVYVMPSTSGLNASSTPATLTDHLRHAAALADQGASAPRR